MIDMLDYGKGYSKIMARQRELDRKRCWYCRWLRQKELEALPRAGMMANVKKGQTVRAPEWWKHLKWAKRTFWKAQRKADKAEIKNGA